MRVPELLRLPLVSLSEAPSALPLCTLTTGASLLPVMVTVTSWVAVLISFEPLAAA